MARSTKRGRKGKTGSPRGGLARLLFFAGAGLALAAWAVPTYRFALGGGAFCAWALFLWVLSRQYHLAHTMREIDAMSGRDFERFLVQLFRRLGYTARHVGGNGGDFGADLLVEKGERKIAVQAKNYQSNRVGNDAVQQAIAGAAYYDCDEAMVVTNAQFTRAARQQAEGSNLQVHLWDRKVLKKKIELI